MSSISSIGGGSSPWDIYLKQQQSTNSTSSTAASISTDASAALTGTSGASAASPTGATTQTGPAQSAHRGHRHGGGGAQKFAAALADQGVSGTKLSDLRTQIQSAVKDAQLNGTDPRAAVDATLKNAGIDLDKFKQDLGTPGAPPSQDGSTTSTTATGSASATTGTSSIESLLANSGIDPTQFKSSLQTLLSNPASTADNFGSLFSGATLGSEIDVAA